MCRKAIPLTKITSTSHCQTSSDCQTSSGQIPTDEPEQEIDGYGTKNRKGVF